MAAGGIHELRKMEAVEAHEDIRAGVLLVVDVEPRSRQSYGRMISSQWTIVLVRFLAHPKNLALLENSPLPLLPVPRAIHPLQQSGYLTQHCQLFDADDHVKKGDAEQTQNFRWN